jgi:hypothetical protein
LKVAALLETSIVVVDFGASVSVLGELSDGFKEVFLLGHGGNVSWEGLELSNCLIYLI